MIADDVAYVDEPFFQDGPVAVAINEVTAAGTSYFTAAGNDNLIDESEDNEIASWEAPAFRGAGSCPAAAFSIGTTTQALHGLQPGGTDRSTFGITVEPGGERCRRPAVGAALVKG